MTDTVELTALAVTVATTGVGVGADGAGTGIDSTGGSGAVSESTIAVIGELEKALLDDCDESSSLSVSDSDDFSLSSSVASSTGSSLGGTVASSADAFFDEDFSGVSLLAVAVLEAVTPSVLAVVVLSEAGDVGDLSSLNPLSSERIFVLLELRLLLDEVDDELEEAVEDELWLLFVLVGHFLIGTESESSESSLVLSSVAMDRDEMSVLFEVRRRDDEG